VPSHPKITASFNERGANDLGDDLRRPPIDPDQIHVAQLLTRVEIPPSLVKARLNTGSSNHDQRNLQDLFYDIKDEISSIGETCVADTTDNDKATTICIEMVPIIPLISLVLEKGCELKDIYIVRLAVELLLLQQWWTHLGFKKSSRNCWLGSDRPYDVDADVMLAKAVLAEFELRQDVNSGLIREYLGEIRAAETTVQMFAHCDWYPKYISALERALEKELAEETKRRGKVDGDTAVRKLVF
jgi:hypothetical protein